MRKFIITVIFAVYCLVAFSQTNVSAQVLDYYRKVPQEKIFVHTDKSIYIPGDTIWFRAHMVDAATNMPVCRSKFLYVELVGQEGKEPIGIAKIKADADSVFANMIALPADIRPGKYTLAAYTQWMRNFEQEKFYYKQIDIVDSKQMLTDEHRRRNISGISLAVLPEGGNLIAGKQQRLAFKAIGDDGKGVDVDVQIVDQHGTCLAKAESQHLGMGYMSVTIQEEDSLQMIASTRNGLTCSTRIPKALKTGVSLNVNRHGENLLIMPIVSDDLEGSDFSLIIYGAGNLMEKPSKGLKSGTVFRVPVRSMREGVINVALVDSKSNILAERMCFIRYQ